MVYKNKLPTISRIDQTTRDNDFIPITELKEFDTALNAIIDKFDSKNKTESDAIDIAKKLKDIEYNMADALIFDENGEIEGYNKTLDAEGNEVPVYGKNAIDNMVANLNEYYNEFVKCMGNDPDVDNWKIELDEYFAKALNAFENKISSIFTNSANATVLEAKYSSDSEYMLKDPINIKKDTIVRLNPDTLSYTRSINLIMQYQNKNVIAFEVGEPETNSLALTLKIQNGFLYFDLDIIYDNGEWFFKKEKLLGKELYNSFVLNVYKYPISETKSSYVFCLNTDYPYNEISYNFEIQGVFVQSFSFNNANLLIDNHDKYWVYEEVDTSNKPIFNEIYYTKSRDTYVDENGIQSNREVYVPHQNMTSFEENVVYYIRHTDFRLEKSYDLMNGESDGEIKDDVLKIKDNNIVVDETKYEGRLKRLSIDYDIAEVVDGNKAVDQNNYIKTNKKCVIDDSVRIYQTDENTANIVTKGIKPVDNRVAVAFGETLFDLVDLAPGQIINTNSQISETATNTIFENLMSTSDSMYRHSFAIYGGSQTNQPNLGVVYKHELLDGTLSLDNLISVYTNLNAARKEILTKYLFNINEYVKQNLTFIDNFAYFITGPSEESHIIIIPDVSSVPTNLVEFENLLRGNFYIHFVVNSDATNHIKVPVFRNLTKRDNEYWGVEPLNDNWGGIASNEKISVAVGDNGIYYSIYGDLWYHVEKDVNGNKILTGAGGVDSTFDVIWTGDIFLAYKLVPEDAIFSNPGDAHYFRQQYWSADGIEWNPVNSTNEFTFFRYLKVYDKDKIITAVFEFPSRHIVYNSSRAFRNLLRDSLPTVSKYQTLMNQSNATYFEIYCGFAHVGSSTIIPSDIINKRKRNIHPQYIGKLSWWGNETNPYWLDYTETSYNGYFCFNIAYESPSPSDPNNIMVTMGTKSTNVSSTTMVNLVHFEAFYKSNKIIVATQSYFYETLLIHTSNKSELYSAFTNTTDLTLTASPNYKCKLIDCYEDYNSDIDSSRVVKSGLIVISNNKIIGCLNEDYSAVIRFPESSNYPISKNSIVFNLGRSGNRKTILCGSEEGKYLTFRDDNILNSTNSGSNISNIDHKLLNPKMACSSSRSKITGYDTFLLTDNATGNIYFNTSADPTDWRAASVVKYNPVRSLYEINDKIIGQTDFHPISINYGYDEAYDPYTDYNLPDVKVIKPELYKSHNGNRTYLDVAPIEHYDSELGMNITDGYNVAFYDNTTKKTYELNDFVPNNYYFSSNSCSDGVEKLFFSSELSTGLAYIDYNTFGQNLIPTFIPLDIYVTGIIENDDALFVYGWDEFYSQQKLYISKKSNETVSFGDPVIVATRIDFIKVHNENIIISVYDVDNPNVGYVYDNKNATFKQFNISDNVDKFSFNNIIEDKGEIYFLNGSGSNPDVVPGLFKYELIRDSNGNISVQTTKIVEKLDLFTDFIVDPYYDKTFNIIEGLTFFNNNYDTKLISISGYDVNGNFIVRYWILTLNYNNSSILLHELDSISATSFSTRFSYARMFIYNLLTSSTQSEELEKQNEYQFNLIVQKSSYTKKIIDTNNITDEWDFKTDSYHFDRKTNFISLNNYSVSNDDRFTFLSERIAIGTTITTNKTNIVMALTEDNAIGLFDNSLDAIKVVKCKYVDYERDPYVDVNLDTDFNQIAGVILGSGNTENLVFVIVRGKFPTVIRNKNTGVNELDYENSTSEYRIFRVSVNDLLAFDNTTDDAIEMIYEEVSIPDQSEEYPRVAIREWLTTNKAPYKLSTEIKLLNDTNGNNYTTEYLGSICDILYPNAYSTVYWDTVNKCLKFKTKLRFNTSISGTLSEPYELIGENYVNGIHTFSTVGKDFKFEKNHLYHVGVSNRTLSNDYKHLLASNIVDLGTDEFNKYEFNENVDDTTDIKIPYINFTNRKIINPYKPNNDLLRAPFSGKTLNESHGNYNVHMQTRLGVFRFNDNEDTTELNIIDDTVRGNNDRYYTKNIYFTPEGTNDVIRIICSDDYGYVTSIYDTNYGVFIEVMTLCYDNLSSARFPFFEFSIYRMKKIPKNGKKIVNIKDEKYFKDVSNSSRRGKIMCMKETATGLECIVLKTLLSGGLVRTAIVTNVPDLSSYQSGNMKDILFTHFYDYKIRRHLGRLNKFYNDTLLILFNTSHNLRWNGSNFINNSNVSGYMSFENNKLTKSSILLDIIELEQLNDNGSIDINKIYLSDEYEKTVDRQFSYINSNIVEKNINGTPTVYTNYQVFNDEIVTQYSESSSQTPKNTISNSLQELITNKNKYNKCIYPKQDIFSSINPSFYMKLNIRPTGTTQHAVKLLKFDLTKTLDANNHIISLSLYNGSPRNDSEYEIGSRAQYDRNLTASPVLPLRYPAYKINGDENILISDIIDNLLENDVPVNTNIRAIGYIIYRTKKIVIDGIKIVNENGNNTLVFNIDKNFRTTDNSLDSYISTGQIIDVNDNNLLKATFDILFDE